MSTIRCVWEHNGGDSLLHAVDALGAFSRGESVEVAVGKMRAEIASYRRWLDLPLLESPEVEIVQEQVSTLQIRDADSDVLFEEEEKPLDRAAYEEWKALALRSAADFHRLYASIPDKNASCLPVRQTFYGQAPRTAQEMYVHTKNVNGYYFGEIGVDADSEGTIFACRERGFASLEKKPDFLQNRIVEGSYGERWCLRKVLRRFLWHDRIHAKAMYRMARRTFPAAAIPDVFRFEEA